MSDIEFDVKKEEIHVSLSPVLVDIGNSLQEQNTQEKQELLENILGKNTQVIRVFAAGTREQIVEGVSTWQSPGFEESDNNGLSSGGVYRVAAGAIAMEVLPDAKCIVGSRYADNRQPPPSIVMKEELRMLGQSEERIISDPDTFDTVAELIGLIEICEQNNWNRAVCITNEYHCARTQAFLYNLPWLSFNEEKTKTFLNGLERLKSGELDIRVVPAEEIIKAYDQKIYDSHIEKYLNSNTILKRYENERQGVNLIAGGQYARYDGRTNARKMLQRSDTPSVTLI